MIRDKIRVVNLTAHIDSLDHRAFIKHLSAIMMPVSSVIKLIVFN